MSKNPKQEQMVREVVIEASVAAWIEAYAARGETHFDEALETLVLSGLMQRPYYLRHWWFRCSVRGCLWLAARLGE